MIPQTRAQNRNESKWTLSSSSSSSSTVAAICKSQSRSCSRTMTTTTVRRTCSPSDYNQSHNLLTMTESNRKDDCHRCRTHCNFIITLIILLMIGVTDTMGKHHVYTTSNHQRYAMEPQDQTAIVGARVTLPCRVVDKQGVLQWTKDDFGLGTSRNLSGFDRYSMIGSDEEGDYSLDIYPVMLDDDARYQCQVSGTDGEPAIRSTFAKLTVLVPPEAPKILQGEHLMATEDRPVEIECISVGGKPAAEITWIDGLGNVVTDGVEYSTQPFHDHRRFTAKSVLRLIPKMEHHNTFFTCQAQNTADRTYRSVKIKLEVKYAPKVKVNIIGGALAGGRLQEGSDLRLECKSDANPNDVQYRWYINDQPMGSGRKTEMILHNVTRKMHDAIVKCEVQNSIGKSEDSETLDISYGPQFRQRPKSIEADVGNTVSLACDVDSNPPADIVWIQHPIDRVVGVSSNLTFFVSNETAGRYYCKANVAGYQEIAADAYVYLKGPPSIISSKSQYGLIGDTARLECYATSVPKARHVSWTFNGHEINADYGHDYSILIDAVPGGVRSTLIIRDSQSYHYGKYNCTVVNDYGNDIIEIQLQAQKTVPLLMTIVGGVSSVALLLVIIIIIVIYFKCKKKKLPPADVISEHQIAKNCKEAGDRTSNYSDLKVDITTGYVPYADYTTHYSPPPQYLTTVATKTHLNGGGPQNLPMSYMNGSLTGSVVGLRGEVRQDNGLPHSLQGSERSGSSAVSASPNGSNHTTSTQYVQNPLPVDPRYSAIYGNPYLRNSNSSLLPPPTAV